MKAQNEIIAQLTARVEALEASLAQLSAKKATARTPKEMTPEAKEALRLKVNQASRESKLKARAKAAGFDTVEAYQQHIAAKKVKTVPTETAPAEAATVEAAPEEAPAVEPAEQEQQPEAQPEATPEPEKKQPKDRLAQAAERAAARLEQHKARQAVGA